MLTKTQKKERIVQKTKQKVPRFIYSLLRAFFFIGISYLILYPLLTKISMSFMSRQDVFDLTVNMIPKNPTFKNYTDMVQLIDFWGFLGQTTFLTICTTLIQMLSCTVSAYGLARFKFKGRGILFALVIFSLVVPPQTYAISTYSQFRFFDFFGLGSLFSMTPIPLTGTPWPILIMAIGCMGLKNGIFIYILRQFFINLPNEMEEAAFIDGAGVFRTFTHVMLPNAKPALATVFVFSFVWNWNNYEDATLYLRGLKLFPLLMSELVMKLSAALGGAVKVDQTQLTLLVCAGSVMMLLPLIIFFLLTQSFFVQGIERSGLTGV